MADAESWTVAKVLRWAQDDFSKRNFDSPKLEADLLLGECLGMDRVQLIRESLRPLHPSELARFRALIQRRRSGEPIAYILGFREFRGLKFRVDSRVLIPRPDTETLVEVALARTQRSYAFGNALDLCTGSGCVAIAFRHERLTWHVIGADISEAALELAQENSIRLSCAFGMSWLKSDLFEGIPPRLRFDLITANPPYIPSGEIPSLEVDVREFEPRLALDGGTTGLDLVERIIPTAFERLNPGGVLALELHYDQASRVQELLAERGFTEITATKDYGGHLRVLSGVKPL